MTRLGLALVIALLIVLVSALLQVPGIVLVVDLVARAGGIGFFLYVIFDAIRVGRPLGGG